MGRSLARSIVAGVAVCAVLTNDTEARDRFGSAPERYTLFDTGQAHCRIVLPVKPEPEEKDAAALLQSTLQDLGQVKIAIVADGTPATPGLITVHVGRTNAAVTANPLPPDLDADGFVIKPAGPEALLLLGARPLSTYYAVTEFLERYAGVLWVWPKEYGTVTPRLTRFEADVREQVSEPVFLARRFSGMKDAQMRRYRIHLGGREVRSEFHHNVWKVLKPDTYWATHPEYFAELNGQRHKPARNNSGWQACTTNPEVVALFTAAAKKQFDSAPWVTSFSVSQNDGGGFCTCARCRALDVPGEAGISDRYYTFMNAVADGVAAAYPDKRICCLAYGVATRDTPKRIVLRPNTMIYAVIPTLQDVHVEIEKWAAVAPRLGVYFWMHGKPVPKFYPHRLAKYLQFLRGHKVNEVYAEVYQDNPEKWASFELDGPRVWIMAKLLWDPDADIDELMERFCSRFYGKAKAPMLNYYRRCETAWERRENPDDFGRKWRDHELNLYTAEDADYMTACLTEALQLADTEPVRQRLELLRHEFSRTALWARQYDLKRTLGGMRVTDAQTADRLLATVQKTEQLAGELAARGILKSSVMPPECEVAVDAAFASISTALGAEAAAFWETRRPQFPQIARFTVTQARLLAGALPNLARNGSFETRTKAGAAPDAKLEWNVLDAAGWNDWIRPGTPGSVGVDGTCARSGTCSVVIQGCEAASALQHITVSAGQRYRVSCWAKTNAVPAGQEDEPDAGSLTLKWMAPGGKWLEKYSPVVSVLPRGATDWQQQTCLLTIPQDVGRLVVMLSSSRQRPEDRIWFDDVVVERVYDPEQDRAVP